MRVKSFSFKVSCKLPIQICQVFLTITILLVKTLELKEISLINKCTFYNLHRCSKNKGVNNGLMLYLLLATIQQKCWVGHRITRGAHPGAITHVII